MQKGDKRGRRLGGHSPVDGRRDKDRGADPLRAKADTLSSSKAEGTFSLSREEDEAVPLIKLELTPADRVLLEVFLSPPSLPPTTLALGFANPLSVSSPTTFALAASGMAKPAVARAIASATSSAASTSAVNAAVASCPPPSPPPPLPLPVPLVSSTAASPAEPSGTAVVVADSTVAVAAASLLSPATAANTLPPRSSLAMGPLQEEDEEAEGASLLLFAKGVSPLQLAVTPAGFSALPAAAASVGTGGEEVLGHTPPKEGGRLPGVLCRCRVYLGQ